MSIQWEDSPSGEGIIAEGIRLRLPTCVGVGTVPWRAKVTSALSGVASSVPTHEQTPDESIA